jgi:hypothetical protein
MMDAKTYQIAAERTMIDTDNDLRMVNAALGLCGEAAELYLVTVAYPKSPILELGDLCWYVAQMCKSQGWSIDTFVPHSPAYDDNDESPVSMIFLRTGIIADMVKKAYFHKRPLEQCILASQLRILMHYVEAVAVQHELDMDSVYAANIDKLRRRYPDGYSHEAANARADEITDGS